MSFAALVRAMSAAGATPEAIALALEAIEQAQGQVDSARAAAAERKRRQRQRERDASQDSHVTVTGQGRDEPAPAPSPLPSPCTPNQPHAPTPTRGDIPARTRGAVAWPCPAGVEPAHWADLLANRKRKRQANTATAYQRLLRDLAKFTDDDWPPGRIVQHAAERGWAAIFDPRQSETRNGHRPDYHDRPSGWAARPGAEGFEPASLDD